MTLKEKDVLFEQAKAYAIEQGKISCEMIQIKFLLGYNRAGRIMDELEDAGVVGQFTGSVYREVIANIG